MLRQDALRAARLRDVSLFAEIMLTLAFGNRALDADENIMAVQVDSSRRLEAISGQLIKSGLRMTHHGKFADFAIVHGEHGLAMDCDWLTFNVTPDGGEVQFRTNSQYVEGLDSFTTESQDVEWIDQMGHGFVLDSGDDYNVWLDFNSGRTVVSLKD